MRTILMLTLALAFLAALPHALGDGEARVTELEATLDSKLAERRRRAVELGELYQACGNWAQAAKHYEAARLISDDDIHVLVQLVSIYRTQKDDAKLLSVYAALSRLQPISVSWLRELGSCYFRLGRGNEAEATWRKMLEATPNRSAGLRYLAQTYEQHNLFQKAVTAYRQALDMAPGDEDIRIRLAEALCRARDPLGALATLSAFGPPGGSRRTSRVSAITIDAFQQLNLPDAARVAVAKLHGRGQCSMADLAWAIAQWLEGNGDHPRAAEFYRRVAKEEPLSDRGKAATDKARLLEPKP